MPGSKTRSPSFRLVLIAEGSDYKVFRIAEILEESPATEGLQKDDLIVVDGRPAAELTLTSPRAAENPLPTGFP
jgi:hypothetical protein